MQKIKTIYNYLKDKGKEILDVIALECNIPTYKLAGILLNMELKGVIRPVSLSLCLSNNYI